jgi:transcriptional regulator of NAD metabolism
MFSAGSGKGGTCVKTDERRGMIIAELSGAGEAVTGSDLASRFGVSRQVIVQDMAVLRAEGLPVVATPRGYILLRPEGSGRLVKTVVTRHRDYEAMEEELLIMVGCGAKVLNVIVEHPLYGEITGNLMLSTTADVARFMESIRKSAGEPLSSLTGGVHLHTLEVDGEEGWERLLAELGEKNYLPEGR